MEAALCHIRDQGISCCQADRERCVWMSGSFASDMDQVSRDD